MPAISAAADTNRPPSDTEIPIALPSASNLAKAVLAERRKRATTHIWSTGQVISGNTSPNGSIGLLKCANANLATVRTISAGMRPTESASEGAKGSMTPIGALSVSTKLTKEPTASCNASDVPWSSKHRLVHLPSPQQSYATPSTDEVRKSLAPYVKECHAILLASHGVVTMGASLEEALGRMEKVEQTAHVLTVARILGGAKRLTTDELTRLRKVSITSYGKDPGPLSFLETEN